MSNSIFGKRSYDLIAFVLLAVLTGAAPADPQISSQRAIRWQQ